MKATITNQCAAPTTLQLSIRVCPRVSVSIVRVRAPRSPKRAGSG